jgi:hypothetical protein
MTTTRLRIELKIKGATQDEVLANTDVMDWLANLAVQCAVYEIEMIAWLDNKRLDISVVRVDASGEKPS